MNPIITFGLFIFFLSITPGPISLLLMLCGAQYGIQACIPFNLGTVISFTLLNFSVGFGFGAFISESFIIQTILKFISAIYMIWLAIQSWNPRHNTLSVTESYFTVQNGFLICLINPKAWAALILVWTDLAGNLGSFIVQIMLIVSIVLVIQITMQTTWCSLGALLGRSFTQSVWMIRAMVIVTVSVILTILIM